MRRHFVKIIILILFVICSKSIFALNSRGVPVLCYHNVSKKGRDIFSLSPRKFEKQIKYLYDSGFKTIKLDTFMKYIKGERVRNFPSKPILLTFDDGWITHYKNVLPILKKYNFIGVFFIYPSVIMAKRRFYRKRYINVKMLKKLHKAGMEIESHSYFHPVMHREDNRTIRVQFRNSKKYLEKKLGKKIKYFAYPYGSYTRNIIKIAKKYGYKGLFTINYGVNHRGSDPYTLYRIMITRSMKLRYFRYLVNCKPLRIKKLDPINGEVYKKVKHVAFYFKNRFSKRDYRIRVYFNNRRIRKYKYYPSKGLLYFYTKRAVRGMNTVKVTVRSRINKRDYRMASWIFIKKSKRDRRSILALKRRRKRNRNRRRYRKFMR